MAARSPWERLALGPDAHAAEQAGRDRARAGGTARDLALDIERIDAMKDVDLHELRATQAEAREDRRRRALRRQRRAGLATATVAESPVEPGPERHPASVPPRRGHLGYVVVLCLLAGLDGLVNFSVLQILGLDPTTTRLVAIGLQILIVYVSHACGDRLGVLLRSSNRQAVRWAVHVALFLTTAGALVAVVATLSIVRGEVFVAVLLSGGGDGTLAITSAEATALFASLTALLAAAAVDIGFIFSGPRRARRRGERRDRRAAARVAARRVGADEELRAMEEIQGERLLARQAQWQSAIKALEAGFRAEATVEVLFELDRSSLAGGSTR
jgi:hypothetical protein